METHHLWSAYTPNNHIAASVAIANKAMTAAAPTMAPTTIMPMAHPGKPAAAVEVGLSVLRAVGVDEEATT